jgi:murein DD-endopeptidase MepM/ murein hydrolase activator NlpD
MKYLPHCMTAALQIILTLLFPIQSQAQATNATGYYYPTGTASFGSYCKWLCHNPDFGGWHLADDIDSDFDAPVYAIDNGVVVLSDPTVSFYGGITATGGSRPGGALVVRHFTRAGRIFYSLYGHLKTDSLLAVGTSVSSGSIIARIGHYYLSSGADIPHLHHGIMPDNLPSNPYRGYTSNEHGNHYGFVNPWHDVSIEGHFYEGFLDHNLPSYNASTTVYFVDAVSGNDNNNGLEGSPFRTVGKAISVVPIGNTTEVIIRIKGGTYTAGEPRPLLTGRRKIRLRNNGGGTVRIRP